MTRPLLTALLYASLCLGANAVTAEPVSPETLAALPDLRSGTMGKLQVHDNPRPLDMPVFKTLDGVPVTLADSAGKIRILNFWATWCAPCKVEKPTLEALNADLAGPDFQIVALATGRNTVAGIKRFNEQAGIATLDSYIDPRSQVAQGLGVRGLPVSILVDRDGNEIARMTGGGDWNSDSARAIIAALIAD